MLRRIAGTAMPANIKTMVTTTSSSTKENPAAEDLFLISPLLSEGLHRSNTEITLT